MAKKGVYYLLLLVMIGVGLTSGDYVYDDLAEGDNTIYTDEDFPDQH